MALITLKQILNQLLVDVTSDEPTRELAQTAQQLRRASHAALREDQQAIGALRSSLDDEPTDPGLTTFVDPPESAE